MDSKSATGLYKAIVDEGAEAVRLRDVTAARPGAHDLVVNWGACRPGWPWRTRILNRSTVGNKLDELRLLMEAGVPVPHFRTDNPGRDHDRWVARRFDHFEANDVRANLKTGDFYTRWIDIDKEFRFHIFNGLSIQQQYKKADGLGNKGEHIEPHAWIRSTASGWNWYNGGDGTPAMREAAKTAVAAVGYDFGAVDVGRIRTGGFVILEVNSGPGIDVGGTTVYKYAEHIIKLAKEIA